MSNFNAPHDDNAVPTALFAQQGATSFVAPGQIDQITGRILVDLAGGGGVAGALQNDIFVATANQTVFNATKTVAGTIYLSINGQIQTPSNVDNPYYTVSGNTATLSSGAVVGSIINWMYATS
jgi:hypothetical protein